MKCRSHPALHLAHPARENTLMETQSHVPHTETPLSVPGRSVTRIEDSEVPWVETIVITGGVASSHSR